MSLGKWLNNLTAIDHAILLILFIIGVYLSHLTLRTLFKFYDEKTTHSKYRLKLRITPFSLLSLGLFYTYLIYQLLDGTFTFIP